MACRVARPATGRPLYPRDGGDGPRVREFLQGSWAAANTSPRAPPRGSYSPIVLGSPGAQHDDDDHALGDVVPRDRAGTQPTPRGTDPRCTGAWRPLRLMHLSTYTGAVIRTWADEPELGRQEMHRVVERCPRAVSVPHYNALLGRIYFGPLRGEQSRVGDYIAETWPAYRKSSMITCQETRIELLQCRARSPPS